MVRLQKPDEIDIIDEQFGSEQSEDAAKAIKEHWDEAQRNLREIARMSDIPSSTVSKVYNKHMGPTGGSKTMSELREEKKQQQETRENPQAENVGGMIPVREALEMSQESYRTGYQDCLEDITEIIEAFGVQDAEELKERLNSR